MSRGARNDAAGFGGVSRAMHWAMAVAILGMLGFGTYLGRMEPSLANLWMYGLHKSVGLCLLAALVLRVIWHRISPPPEPLSEGIAPWQRGLARGVHGGLYLLMAAVPLTGWIGSSATGIDTVFFGRWTVPPIAPVSERLEDIFMGLHWVLTKVLVLCLVLHVAGALDRHFHKGDATLRRMWRGRA